MGTATGPAGQLAIGGSKGRTGAKGEAAVPGACSPPTLPSAGGAKEAGGLSPGGRGLFTKTRYSLSSSGFIDIHDLRHKRGGQRWVYRKGRLGPRPEHPTPARKFPRTLNCAQTRLEPCVVSPGRPRVEWTGKWSKKAIPKGEGLQFSEKLRNQVLPRVLQFFSSLKHFLNLHKQNQIEQLSSSKQSASRGGARGQV